jgi:hypothetical protein
MEQPPLPKVTIYTCPVCRGQWRYGHHPALELPPRDGMIEKHVDLNGVTCRGSRCQPVEGSKSAM